MDKYDRRMREDGTLTGQCVRRSTGDEQQYAHKWQWRQNGARRRRAERRLQSAMVRAGGGPFMEADKYLVEAVATGEADESPPRVPSCRSRIEMHFSNSSAIRRRLLLGCERAPWHLLGSERAQTLGH